MPWIETKFEGLMIFEPQVWEDDRGYFFESYNKNTCVQAGLNHDFVQDNEARSGKGVLRGLHYQRGPLAQAKLVRVVQGKVQDVVVDLRTNSKTYGKHFSIILSDENKKQLLVPRGFAHGYLTLSENVLFLYKCDNYYSKVHEAGIRYDDPSLKIEWMLDIPLLSLSDKDLALPYFVNHAPIDL